MKRSSKIILVSALALLLLGGFLLSTREERKLVPIEVTVTNSSLVGFNTGTDKLYFGTLTADSFADRKATLVSAYDSTVVITIKGQAGPWVAVSQNDFFLPANTPREVVFRLIVPSATMPGNYTGTAIIEYKKS